MPLRCVVYFISISSQQLTVKYIKKGPRRFHARAENMIFQKGDAIKCPYQTDLSGYYKQLQCITLYTMYYCIP